MKDSEAHGQGGAVFSRAQIVSAMQALPFVTWDKTGAPSPSCGEVIGYINYPDRERERDFVLLRWDSSGLSFTTGSEAHRQDIAERLADEVGRFARVGCLSGWRPVAEVFGDGVNRYVLPEAPGGEGDPKPSQLGLFDENGGRYLEGA